MKLSTSFKCAAVLVLSAFAGAGFGAYSRDAQASEAPTVITLEPVTIVGSATPLISGPESIELPAMTITGSVAPKAAHKATSAKRGPVPYDASKCAELISRYGAEADYRCPRGVRVIALEQGGRPGARTVRAWGI